MNRNRLPADLYLAYRAIFTIDDAAGVDIACREGCLWITLDNDTRDIVLEGGRKFTTQEHRRAVVYAMESSHLTMTAAPIEQHSPRMRRQAASAPRVSHA